MPRRSTPPKYRIKTTYGRQRALVTLSDSRTKKRKDFYLGDAGSPESRQKYACLLAQWEANDRRLSGVEQVIPPSHRGPTITQLCHDFWLGIRDRYSRKQEGHFKLLIRLLRDYYGPTPAAEFGPKALRLLRNEMVRGGEGRRPWTRQHINRQTHLIRQIFKWGVSHEMIPVTVLDALRTVEALKRGRTDAIETPPVRPVPEAMLRATLPHLNRQVRAVVQLQLLTGARPSELLCLRPRDILTGEHPHAWIVQPLHHKTAHQNRSRTIYFGPKAQKVLQPFITDRLATVYMFSPIEAERERRQAMHAARRTPMSFGNRPGTNISDSPIRSPREHYDADSYRRAIQYACDRAFPPPPHLGPQKGETEKTWKARLTPKQKAELNEWRRAHRWHPYQLRHNAATSLRREFGLEAAQLILGHSSAQITDAVYADRDREKILGIVKKIG